ncbi:hypothetical protein [Pedobacter borealis]|uniref:hypothetical protein n=1 Tax=Pedobacter borealis TaxID=475254 RepID=UPI0004939139|nr:hypothetical protein [Pedobacter borealis]
MKKNKSKSKSHSTSKKLRKELESKLALAFNELVIQYGKAKKADKVIEKFAKQLTKKVTFNIQDDSITPYIKEEKDVSPVSKEKPVKATIAKSTGKEIIVKEEIEEK